MKWEYSPTLIFSLLIFYFSVMSSEKEIETFNPKSREEWRLWLEKHHQTKQSVWLILHKKDSGKPSVSWSEIVDESLCFGWIDSTRKSVNEESFMQLVSRRKASGTWSKVNKEKITQLIADGRMREAGLQCIEKAKENGSWTILDTVEELTIPDDLEKAFQKHREAKAYFLSLSKSAKKTILQRLVLAKRPETRQKRVEEIATLAAQKQKPKLF